MKTVIDLFAGCGGLSLGLEQAGFTPIFVNELNVDAMGTYFVNRVDTYPWLVHNKEYNIKDIIVKADGVQKLHEKLKNDFSINQVDLIVGGPPCQGFSGIGHRRSYSVDKKQLPSNHLYEDMAYLIHKMQPKAFLFENVRGLLSAKWTKDGEKGEIWADVLHRFKSLKGYVVRWALVHAKEYGVPQNRPRVLLVGVQEKYATLDTDKRANGLLPEPIGGYPNIEDLLGDLIDEDYKDQYVTSTYPSRAKNDWQRYFRVNPSTKKINPKGSKLTEQEYSKHSEAIENKFRHMIHGDGTIPENMRTKKFAQKVLPKKWGATGPSITATSMPDDYVHYQQPRVLTVREWARLQTFPDWYEFKGKRTTGGLRRAGNPRENIFEREVPKYTQIGNAVPVKMAYEVGKHLLKIIDQ